MKAFVMIFIETRYQWYFYRTSGLPIASVVSWSITAMLTETSAADKLDGVAVISVTSFEASKEAELTFC